MYKLTSLAAASLLLASTHAVPNPNPNPTPTAVQPRETEVDLKPWVTINENGTVSTVTPVLSTIDGTPTVISGAPHDLTATVFTTTSYGKVITTTLSVPPRPTATGDNSGSFAVCHNLDGNLAPWCLPHHDVEDEPLYVGSKYPFTWDSEFFKAPNATVSIVGNYINQTTGEVRDKIAFDSSLRPAALGYWVFDVKDSLLLHQGSQNISLMLIAADGGKKTVRQGPTIKVTTRPGPKADSHGHLPQGASLYIALPTVLGFIIICVVGTCLWNRHHRQIKLPNVMGRNYDVGKTGRSRFGRKKRDKAAKADERIQLMEREIAAEGGEVYRDLPDPTNRPRRDSDALGSLAGTPTQDRRMDLGPRSGSRNERDGSPVTGNAFREELKRQADKMS